MSAVPPVFVLSQRFSENLQRSVQVKLSTVILPIIQSHVQDKVTTLLYLAISFFVFQSIHWLLFQDVIITMCITLLFQFLTLFQQHMSQWLVFVNVTSLFIIVNTALRFFPVSTGARITSNMQYIIAGILLESCRVFIQNEFMVVFLLLFIVALTYAWNLHVNDSALTELYMITTTQAVQDLLLGHIPEMFLIPSLVILLYGWQILIMQLKIAKAVEDFILYSTAQVIQAKLKSLYPVQIIFVICILSIHMADFLKIHKSLEIMQTLTLFVCVDWILSSMEPMYRTDPVVCLVSVLFCLRLIGRFLGG